MATDWSDSERRKQSNVGLQRVVRCPKTSKLILADIKRAMKHAEDIDITAVLDQVGDSIMSVQQYAHIPGRSPVSCAHFRKVR